MVQVFTTKRHISGLLAAGRMLALVTEVGHDSEVVVHVSRSRRDHVETLSSPDVEASQHKASADGGTCHHTAAAGLACDEQMFAGLEAFRVAPLPSCPLAASAELRACGQ